MFLKFNKDNSDIYVSRTGDGILVEVWSKSTPKSPIGRRRASFSLSDAESDQLRGFLLGQQFGTKKETKEKREAQEVRSIFDNSPVDCSKCGHRLFYPKGRSLDYYHWECANCGTEQDSLTETGASR